MASKFITQLAGNGDAIKLRRAGVVAEAARIAQEALVNNIRARLNRLEVTLAQLTDLAPETGDSLRPGAGFEAQSWVTGVHSLKLDIAKAREELAVANDTAKEWFGDNAEPTTAAE